MAQIDEISRRLVDAGLSARSALAGPLLTDFVLMVLTPLFDRFSTPAAALAAGARSVTDLTLQEIAAELRIALRGLGESVLALWPFESTLVELETSELIAHLDDLWFPSSDDLWIIATDGPKFVFLDHEENLLVGEFEIVSR